MVVIDKWPNMITQDSYWLIHIKDSNGPISKYPNIQIKTNNDRGLCVYSPNKVEKNNPRE